MIIRNQIRQIITGPTDQITGFKGTLGDTLDVSVCLELLPWPYAPQ
jgi:hypothetical protein